MDRAAARALLVVGCGALTVVLWFVPEYLGSGDLLRAASRAREPEPRLGRVRRLPVRRDVPALARSVLMVPLLLGAVIALVRRLARRATGCG